MRRRLSTSTIVVLALVPLAALAASCSSDDDASDPSTTEGTGSSESQEVAIVLSDAGCEPFEIEVAAGPTTFVVTNDGGAAVTEFEVMQDGEILGEVENVIPGAERDFTLTLEAGSYVTYCPNGDVERGTLEVS